MPRNRRRLSESAHRQAMPPEVDPRGNARPAHLRGVVRLAQILDVPVEPLLPHQVVEPLVERVPRRVNQVGRRHPHGFVLLAGPLAHGHDPSSLTRQDHLYPEGISPGRGTVTFATGC
jgi:hypothetical protein